MSAMTRSSTNDRLSQPSVRQNIYMYYVSEIVTLITLPHSIPFYVKNSRMLFQQVFFSCSAWQTWKPCRCRLTRRRQLLLSHAFSSSPSYFSSFCEQNIPHIDLKGRHEQPYTYTSQFDRVILVCHGERLFPEPCKAGRSCTKALRLFITSDNQKWRINFLWSLQLRNVIHALC